MEKGIASLAQIQGTAGVIGQNVSDPLALCAKLRLVRCPVVMIRGTTNPSVMAHVEADPLGMLAAACQYPPTVIDAASGIEDFKGTLRNELVWQVMKALKAYNLQRFGKESCSSDA